MTTFVNEQVKRLDTTLVRSFEKSLQGTDSIKSFGSLNENDQFLFKATQAIDLTSSTLPTFDKVQEYLEKYRERFSSKDSLIQSETDPALEWLFVAKCTIAVYGQVFSKVLNLTLPISESIDYWNSIHGSTTQEVYYGLQSMFFIRAIPITFIEFIFFFFSCTFAYILFDKECHQANQRRVNGYTGGQITFYVVRLSIGPIIPHS